MTKLIGFWGYPHPELIEKYKNQYPNHTWVDLDIDFNAQKSNILPDNYCKIIRNIIDNALERKSHLEVILAPIGKDKCDSGWFASELLKDMGFNVVQSVFEDISNQKQIKISTSNLPLREKFELITANIIGDNEKEFAQVAPRFGFWGVPPNDLRVLELFPNDTHVYGWTRCVEANAPSDIQLEMFVDEDVPTVFYSQAFCAKAQLAKYLADKYNGLYIDIDDVMTNSVKYKIEAFLELR